MGLLNGSRVVGWLTSDWTTVAKHLTVYETEALSGDSCMLHYYDVVIEEHKETGERRMTKRRSVGNQFCPYASERLPNVLDGVSGGLIRRRTDVYNADFIRESFGVDR